MTVTIVHDHVPIFRVVRHDWADPAPPPPFYTTWVTPTQRPLLAALSKFVCCTENPTINLVPDRVEWRFGPPAPSVEVDPNSNFVLTNRVWAGEQGFNFRMLDGLCGLGQRPAAAAFNLGPDRSVRIAF